VTIPNTETYKVGDNYIKVGEEIEYEWTYQEGADVHEANIAMISYARAEAAYVLAEDKKAKGIVKPSQLRLDNGAQVAQAPPSATETAFGPPDATLSESAAPPATDAPEPVEVGKFKLEKRAKDDRLELSLFPVLGDGRVGKYRELSFVAARESVWEMIKGVVGDRTFNLPIEEECSWTAHYTWGKTYTGRDGSEKRYKDLQRLEAR
jgi:hypothetical protein